MPKYCHTLRFTPNGYLVYILKSLSGFASFTEHTMWYVALSTFVLSKNAHLVAAEWNCQQERYFLSRLMSNNKQYTPQHFHCISWLQVLVTKRYFLIWFNIRTISRFNIFRLWYTFTLAVSLSYLIEFPYLGIKWKKML